MPQKIIELLKQCANANFEDDFRRENLVVLPGNGDLIATGDIHGHRRNFEKIKTYADLKNHPERHLILQEIIHGGAVDEKQNCLSYQLLFDVARYKINFPNQIHLLLSNHDTAFISNTRVLKDGKEMNASIRRALDREFKQNSGDIKMAIAELLFSQPLAARCENRIWLSHSLPSDILIKKFDKSIFHRHLKVNDIVKPGSAYILAWGRKMSRQTLEKMAQMLDVDCFILGHQPQSMGFKKAAENLLIVASDHNHGCLLHIELKKSYTTDELLGALVPLASIE